MFAISSTVTCCQFMALHPGLSAGARGSHPYPNQSCTIACPRICPAHPHAPHRLPLPVVGWDVPYHLSCADDHRDGDAEGVADGPLHDEGWRFGMFGTRVSHPPGHGSTLMRWNTRKHVLSRSNEAGFLLLAPSRSGQTRVSPHYMSRATQGSFPPPFPTHQGQFVAPDARLAH